MFEQLALTIVMGDHARNVRDEHLNYIMQGVKYSFYVDKNGDIDKESISTRELTSEEKYDLNPSGSPWRDNKDSYSEYCNNCSMETAFQCIGTYDKGKIFSCARCRSGHTLKETTD